MAVRIRRYGGTYVETRGMVLEVSIEEVGIYGVDDIAADKEGVSVGAGYEATDALVGELVYDALNDCGKKVAASALSEERTDFLVIEKSDNFDLR